MKLVITQNITVNGVVETNEATGDWFDPAGGEADMSDIEDALRDTMATEDAMLFGRQTFEDMRGFWPNQTDDTTGITDHLDQVQKYVASTTMSDPEWQNSTVLEGELIDQVRQLKEQPGNSMGVTGSIGVCHALIAAGLVDEYRLFVYPVVVAPARRLFDADATGPLDLQLVESRSFTSGIVLLTYRPAAAS